MRKKTLLFVVMTALFLLVSPGLWAESSGSCGENIKWTLDDQGVLTFEGTGTMSNYDDGESPWKGPSVTTAVIGDGITKIGNYAFMDCTGLTSVTIPNSVTKIGEGAFYGCTGLTSVTIPASVTDIGFTAFYRCTGLEKIKCLAENPPTCGNYAFDNVDMSKCVVTVPGTSVDEYKNSGGWENFTNIEGAASVVASGDCGENAKWTLDSEGELTIEGEGAMTDYTYTESSPWKDLSFTTAVIGDGITKIGEYAFNECKGLASVEFSNTVTSIGERAFQECSGLTSVTIGENVTTIDIWAFVGCSSLTSVTFGKNVTSIGENAFLSCRKLATVTSLNPEPPTLGNDGLSLAQDATIYVPAESVDAYKNAKNWSNYSDQIKALSDGGGTQSGTCGENLTWTLDSEGVLTIEGQGAMYNYNGESPQWADLSPTTAVIGDGITTIGDYAFDGCYGLASVTIPNSVTKIGEAAFSETGLTSVTIPASVTNIDNAAFYGCLGLTKIESLAETPPTCGDNAFYGVDKNQCVLSVPEKSVEAYKAADQWKDFTNIEALAKKVVASGTCGDNLTWKLDEQGVLTIEGEGAMADYTYNSPAPWASLSFTTAVIGEGVTTVGKYAFQDYSKLTSVTFPETLTSIEERAFRWCTGLTSVNFPSSLTNIGKDAFSGCTGLTKIESLAEIPPTCGSDVFSGFDKDKCELSVPEKSVEAYKAADQWKDFINIVNGINGVAQNNNVVVFASNGVITVTGTAYNAVVEVYGTNGALLYRGTGKTIAVPSAGIYVVRAAGKTVKVNTAR